MTRLLFFIVFFVSCFSFAQNSSSVFVGRYVVRSVTEDDAFHEGSLCEGYTDAGGQHREADFRCGQTVLVFRSENADQLAIFLAPEKQSENTFDENTLYTFSVFRSALFSQNRKCQMALPVVELPRLFQSDLCRAFRAGGKDITGATQYLFFPNMEPKQGQTESAVDEAVARAIVSGMVTGLPIGMASIYSIEMQPSQVKPSEIVINELITGVVFFSKATLKNIIKLEPLN